MALISVVIPVCNMWSLTRACLKSLAATSPLAELEIIVVDNASTDRTSTECPPLGRSLFGDAFHYLPQEKNKNFGPACNIGAKHAQSEFIFFLHNDTILTEGWLTPLIKRLVTDKTLGAVGPLLLYPKFGGYKNRVQHLGITINHELQCQNLYEGFPAAHPVVQRPRYFQAISGAAFLIRKQLFSEAGGFDEELINCFEAVELCTRISRNGRRFACEPKSVIYHLDDQTTGGYNFTIFNHRNYATKIAPNVFPDFQFFVRQDGFECRLTPWLKTKASLPAEKTNILNKQLENNPPLDLVEALLGVNPLWEEGYFWLAEQKATQNNVRDAVSLMQLLMKNTSESGVAFSLLTYACSCKNSGVIETALLAILSMTKATESYSYKADQLETLFSSNGFEGLLKQVRQWKNNITGFREQHLLPFMNSLKSSNILTYSFSQTTAAYTAWVELYDKPTEQSRQATSAALKSRDDWPYISLIMPTYNTNLTYLEEAIKSVRTQSYPYWELCIADDASTDPGVAALLRRHKLEDARIKVVFRKTNGHIANSSNSALELVAHPWTALIDHDDILATDALFHVARAIQDNPQGKLFYSDEDKLNADGSRNEPYFKPSFDMDMFYCVNYINHLGVYSTERLRATGGFRAGFEGSQDYDLIIRFIEGLSHDTIIHIPRVLYHWRLHDQSTSCTIESKPYVINATKNAISEHLGKINRPGMIEHNVSNHYNVVRWRQTNKELALSLIVFSHNGSYPDVLLESIVKENDLAHCECIIVPVGVPLEQPKEKNIEHKNITVRILECAENMDQANIYARAVRASRGQVLGFLNGDLKPLLHGWLDQLVAEAMRPDNGVVGGLLWHNNKVYHAGYYPDENGRVFPLFHGTDAAFYCNAYMGWLTMSRRVLAVSPDCMFCRREVWESTDGFDPDMGVWSAVDFSLRLWSGKLATLYSPLAQFDFATAPSLPTPASDNSAGQLLFSKWETQLRESELRNPNLCAVNNMWSLFS